MAGTFIMSWREDGTGFTRIIAAGHWQPGARDILAAFDADYDLTRLAWLLADRTAEVAGRLRSDRVMPVIEGTLIRLRIDHLPGQCDTDPV